MDRGENLELDQHLCTALSSLLSCPLRSKCGRFEKLFVRVLLVDEQAREVVPVEFLGNILMSSCQLLLGVTRVKDERLVLKTRLVTCVQDNMWKQCAFREDNRKDELTQSPPNIVLALYIPTAAIRLGLTRRKR